MTPGTGHARHRAHAELRGRSLACGLVKMRDYLATEVALDHAEGHLSRREALHKLGLLGLSTVAASGLLAACAAETAPPAAPESPAPSGAVPSAAPTPAGSPMSAPPRPWSSSPPSSAANGGWRSRPKRC